jgi:hypothetical protein
MKTDYLLVPKNLFLVFWILFSIGIPVAGSRYGIRVEQLFIYAFAVTLLPYFFLKTNVFNNKYIFFVGLFFLGYLPIFLKITNSIVYYNVYQGFFRIFGFVLLGYLITNYSLYKKFYKGIIALSILFLVLAYFQMYHILNMNIFFRIYQAGVDDRLFDQLPLTVFGLAEYTSAFILFSFVPFFIFFTKLTFIKKLKYIPIFILFLYYFYISEARSALVAVTYFVLFYFVYKNNIKNKNKFFNISLFFLILGLVSVVSLYSYISSSEDIIEKSMYIRLTSTWATPIIDWLSGPITFIFGVGLNNHYADSGYTSFLGAFGLLGLVLFYLPIILLLIEIKKQKYNDDFLNYFYYTTMLLLVVNITYPVFTGGRFSDIYWLVFGATVKYLVKYKKQLRIEKQ